MLLGIEAGGTTFVCGRGTGPDDLGGMATIPTTTPHDTLAAVDDWIAGCIDDGVEFAGIGLASFGPLDLDVDSPSHGRLTTTPKPGWQGVDMPAHLRDRWGVPVAIDTDVNGAGVAEARWGALRDCDSAVYLTVGTGIGGGALLDGSPIRGLVHTEMGHLLVRRHSHDHFRGSCPFHADCVEGLASGTALRGRFGLPGHELVGRDLVLARTMTAHYLAQLVVACTLLLTPRRVVLGGGVPAMDGLLDAVRAATVDLLAGAIPHPAITDGATDYVVRPGLGGRAGVLGAIALAHDAATGDGDSSTTPERS
ncbi:ROK family protein [Salsipaludibacter albus]|uniref:ROK family protein n=1 Tax=Salsipaludibacter albus TaxID=2849650 RepID=UPI001EE3F916|nr:ROK family protein [Salsipaludibacter albus]MBY5161019.1 ROK family protein [Salsipaludibacter albus]